MIEANLIETKSVSCLPEVANPTPSRDWRCALEA